jgi:hypothetical protein
MAKMVAEDNLRDFSKGYENIIGECLKKKCCSQKKTNETPTAGVVAFFIRPRSANHGNGFYVDLSMIGGSSQYRDRVQDYSGDVIVASVALSY